MKKSQSKLVMGTAIGLAAIAVAIDHTRHTVPKAQVQQVSPVSDIEQESPCTLDTPCSIESPCSLDESPCGLD